MTTNVIVGDMICAARRVVADRRRAASPNTHSPNSPSPSQNRLAPMCFDQRVRSPRFPLLYEPCNLLSRTLPPEPFLPYFSDGTYATKYLISLAPRAGFEPATNRLTAGCSTAELPGNTAPLGVRSAYNKAASPMKA